MRLLGAVVDLCADHVRSSGADVGKADRVGILTRADARLGRGTQLGEHPWLEVWAFSES